MRKALKEDVSTQIRMRFQGKKHQKAIPNMMFVSTNPRTSRASSPEVGNVK